VDLGEKKRTRVLICFALAAVTLGVYFHVGSFGFVNFDDPEYIMQNRMVKAGLTVKGLVWAFTHAYAANWHPLTWISFMTDCQIFGMNAAEMHWVNILFHTANSVLLFILLERITGARWRSAIVAAFFALHPLHVESVVWIPERKDVLSTFFGLLALLAYVRYVEGSKLGTPKSKRWFAVSLVFFAMGMMAKPMLVTLPFVLLLLDFWPLQRVENIGWRTFFAAQFGNLVREKWLWFVFAAIASAITFCVQKSGGAVADVASVSFSQRALVAAESYFWYFQKTFWPARLAIFYPLENHRPGLLFAGACAFLIIFSCVAVCMARQRPYLIFGWLWFLGTLVPVIGIVQVGTQGMADRYDYVPSIGIFIIVTWWGYEFIGDSKLKLRLAGCGVTVLLFASAAMTIVQAGYWKNSLALFRHALEVTHNNAVAWNNLGVALYDAGQYENAVAAYNSAIQIRSSADYHKNLGLALVKVGKPQEALVEYGRASELEPKGADIQFFSGKALEATGKKDEALLRYEEAARLDPNDAFYQNNLGVNYAAIGRKADALAHYAEAARLEPESAQYQNNLGTALARDGQEDAAIEHYKLAVRDDPKFAEPESNLGALYASRHRLEDAALHYQIAVQLNPTNVMMRLNAGRVFAKLGNAVDAAAQFEEAVRLDPSLSEAHGELGKQLLDQGQFQAARDQFAKVIQLKPGDASAEFYFGVSCFELHDTEAGLEHLAVAERLRPDWPSALNAHAWVLATTDDDKLRNSQEALRLAGRAAELTTYQQPAVLQTLAAAYAANGQFDKAIATANQALDLAKRAGQGEVATKTQQALKLYQAGQPFREKRADDK
jgi:tetratricopeptide (TPR) repeat protein